MKTKSSTFKIRPFKNPSGQVVYQVDGFINGKRIRKNFQSRKDAVAEKDAQALEAIKAADSNLRLVSTFLADAELREAESVFLKIRDDKRSLSHLVDFALTNCPKPDKDITLVDALKSYRKQRDADLASGLISAPQHTTIRRTLASFTKHTSCTNVSGVTPALIRDYCSRQNASLKTFNNRRGVLSTFFKFALVNEWIASNPMVKIPQYRIAHKRGTAATLTAAQAAALMEFVESYEQGCMAPFFALCLFAGIRPCLRTGEISKLTAENVNLETGVIHIEPEVSKVDMKRNITIQPNLAAWLAAYPLTEHPIIIPNMQHLRAFVAKRFGLSHDVMRHTFISMHVAKFRSMGDTALQAGNSEAIIRRHYLDVKSPAETEAFFNILPRKVPVESPAKVATVSVAESAEPAEARQLAA
ncbi:hypothetical protein [Ereboglobus luteus]|uniref:Core-binding (CB) domain-containing protein n=1 Tax=Ereboglobus luteus TaxID=1796921 RepID=A0A2U8E607_9BACT|nr:hypothetical protein [Ereboglobus luteus]AWI10303.1 hypothetical protein CKA38_14510 [Ereboglobus luteus]